MQSAPEAGGHSPPHSTVSGRETTDTITFGICLEKARAEA